MGFIKWRKNISIEFLASTEVSFRMKQFERIDMGPRNSKWSIADLNWNTARFLDTTNPLKVGGKQTPSRMARRRSMGKAIQSLGVESSFPDPSTQHLCPGRRLSACAHSVWGQ